MTARFMAERLGCSQQWAVSDEWSIVFRGSEVEAKAVATALLRANGLHLSVSAESVADERNATLSMLADASSEAEAYNALVELIDAVVGSSGEDPESVARGLVRRFHLGSVCPRCDFVYLNEPPEECEICEEKLAA